MGRWNTCDLYDDNEGKVQTCAIILRHFGGIDRYCGSIETVLCREDNTLAKGLLAQKGDGKVLVVDGNGSMACALLGDRMATLAMANGWRGIIINGMVRDSMELSKIPFGVMALGTNPKKSRKDGIGTVGATLFFGAATFKPGMYVYCDNDGILLADHQLH